MDADPLPVTITVCVAVHTFAPLGYDAVTATFTEPALLG
jgi:hypothetical protein